MDYDRTRIETYLGQRKGEIDGLEDNDRYLGFAMLEDVVQQYMLDQEIQEEYDLETYLDLFASNMRYEYKRHRSYLKEQYAKAVEETVRMKERIFS